jgi:hypothetical protein
MKKLICILVLGLLLAGCSTTSSNMDSGNIKIGMSKRDFCIQMNTFSLNNSPCYKPISFSREIQNILPGIYYPETKKEIMHDSDKKEYFFVFQNVNTPYNYRTLKRGDGTLEKIFKDLDDAKTFASQKSFLVDDNKVDKQMKACKDLGLIINTEEFGSCVLKKLEEQQK